MDEAKFKELAKGYKEIARLGILAIYSISYYGKSKSPVQSASDPQGRKYPYFSGYDLDFACSLSKQWMKKKWWSDKQYSASKNVAIRNRKEIVRVVKEWPENQYVMELLGAVGILSAPTPPAPATSAVNTPLSVGIPNDPPVVPASLTGFLDGSAPEPARHTYDNGTPKPTTHDLPEGGIIFPKPSKDNESKFSANIDKEMHFHPLPITCPACDGRFAVDKTGDLDRITCPYCHYNAALRVDFSSRAIKKS